MRRRVLDEGQPENVRKYVDVIRGIAYIQSFSDGFQDVGNKGDLYAVRACRAF